MNPLMLSHMRALLSLLVLAKIVLSQGNYCLWAAIHDTDSEELVYTGDNDLYLFPSSSCSGNQCKIAPSDGAQDDDPQIAASSDTTYTCDNQVHIEYAPGSHDEFSIVTNYGYICTVSPSP